jgi:hypothetical protein
VVQYSFIVSPRVVLPHFDACRWRVPPGARLIVIVRADWHRSLPAIWARTASLSRSRVIAELPVKANLKVRSAQVVRALAMYLASPRFVRPSTLPMSCGRKVSGELYSI